MLNNLIRQSVLSPNATVLKMNTCVIGIMTVVKKVNNKNTNYAKRYLRLHEKWRY